MKIFKTILHNQMGDEWMNDCLMTYIERSVLDNIDRELIIQQLLNWNFIKDTLEDIGFPNWFVNLVWHCISSPIMRVLWSLVS
ncbi:hypothetical protein MTR_2g094120 [Medicago truncatula]|uniref:Uncharacterized protein n=1 Tax=Medicago truncatula TaxID=3880 RepID=G7IRQ9_MEDTR|nr:hypothetical protein MTR_2g094120 [Medicago truncatula]